MVSIPNTVWASVVTHIAQFLLSALSILSFSFNNSWNITCITIIPRLIAIIIQKECALLFDAITSLDNCVAKPIATVEDNLCILEESISRDAHTFSTLSKTVFISNRIRQLKHSIYFIYFFA